MPKIPPPQLWVRKRIIALPMLFLPPLLWASLVVVGSDVMTALTPLELTAVTWMVAVIALLPWILPAIVRHGPTLRKEWLTLLAAGALGTTGFQYLWYLGLAKSNPIDVALLTPTLPVMMCIADRFIFQAAIDRTRAAGIALTVIAAIYLGLEGNVSDLLHLRLSPGGGLIILANLAMTFYNVILRAYPSRLQGPAYLGIISVTGLISLLPLFVVTPLSPNLGAAIHANLSPILYIGIVAYVLAFLVWNLLIEGVGITRVGLGLCLQPIFGIVLAYLFLGSQLAAYQAAGAFLVCLGLVLALWERPTKRAAAAAPLDGVPS